MIECGACMTSNARSQAPGTSSIRARPACCCTSSRLQLRVGNETAFGISQTASRLRGMHNLKFQKWAAYGNIIPHTRLGPLHLHTVCRYGAHAVDEGSVLSGPVPRGTYVRCVSYRLIEIPGRRHLRKGEGATASAAASRSKGFSCLVMSEALMDGRRRIPPSGTHGDCSCRRGIRKDILSSAPSGGAERAPPGNTSREPRPSWRRFTSANVQIPTISGTSGTCSAGRRGPSRARSCSAGCGAGVATANGNTGTDPTRRIGFPAIGK